MQRKKEKIKIAITMGDAAGIGPEIILNLFKHLENKSLPFELFVIGNYEWLKYVNKKLKINLKLMKKKKIEEYRSEKRIIQILDTDDYDLSKIKIGAINKEAGKASGRFIEEAVNLALNKEIDGIVTAPINKEALNLGGYNYAGHTEMLAELTKTKNYGMMLAAKWLKVVLVTIHIAIKEVSKQISEEKIIEKVRLTNHSLKIDFGIKEPEIAVLGLNPHCGENGLFGDEEERLIKPAILKLQKEGIKVFGPFASDTFFPTARNKYDCVICMYHDQGLIPLKYIGFSSGVNITIGLPIVRTSVDHGTAYDIVLQNKADYNSLKAAVFTAYQIIKNRKHNEKK
ncbi:MAG TPA: 4-hydroxythreonine-4-phosphate dehydrogenase PdxA [bacterium]|nr:4-hydroxythreonine-4-phosphate dehydrogenase PdxA [bacterium]HOL48355.1 4-hydroxythreonine-4-phosphate dehydrogenase PdxA [bacterium]HPQ18013.1 4-hydroxythreonine-4-phosphate dehydrogenase PdxA [bacterium]